MLVSATAPNTSSAGAPKRRNCGGAARASSIARSISQHGIIKKDEAVFAVLGHHV